MCRGRNVSILSQPEGRELPPSLQLYVRTFLFQSSPSPKAGSYRATSKPTWMRSSFNPLPARRPGATGICHPTHRTSGSFNPLPARRPGATKYPKKRSKGQAVSILSQPEGRELLHRSWRWACTLRFQSSPSPKAGSYIDTERSNKYQAAFQSSPSPKAGSYSRLSDPLIAERRFQSSPSPKAGSYRRLNKTAQCRGRFNPLPARRPGATQALRPTHSGEASFNPLPARRPGATTSLKKAQQSDSRFNPLPARRPGATSPLGRARSLP